MRQALTRFIDLSVQYATAADGRAEEGSFAPSRTPAAPLFPLFYGDDGSSYIVVASKGGAPEHPGWYRNLVAHPEVEVQVGTKKTKAKARTTVGAERERLWEKALKFWPPYADYAKKTERQIPVVVLDPVG